MSHNNLMALYCYIEDRKQEIEDGQSTHGTESHQKESANSRLQVLDEFEQFLHETLDRKLPRRIYRQLKSQSNSCDMRYAVGK